MSVVTRLTARRDRQAVWCALVPTQKRPWASGLGAMTGTLKCRRFPASASVITNDQNTME